MRFSNLSLLPALLLAPATALPAQRPDAAALLQQVRSLDQTGRVLVLSARPEEDPAGLVAMLHLGMGMEVGALSLHRGEAGSNRFGREVGTALGVLRVREMLRVREVTGGRQYFTRAYDFGPADSVAEAWRHWPREMLVQDLVSVIRSLRPQALILPCEAPGGVSDSHRSVLNAVAVEAYDQAVDTAAHSRFATGGLAPWRPTYLYRTTCGAEPATLTLDTGTFDPVLGESYAQVGARALAWQQSQGLALAVPPGPMPIGLVLVASTRQAGSPPPRAVLDGVESRWTTLTGSWAAFPDLRAALEGLSRALGELQATFDPRQPDLALPVLSLALTQSRAIIEQLAGASPAAMTTRGGLTAALEATAERLTRLIAASAGISLRLDAPSATVAAGDSLAVTLTISNQGAVPISVLGGRLSIGLPGPMPPLDRPVALAPGESRSWTAHFRTLDPSVPWWLRAERPGDHYQYQPGPFGSPGLLQGEDEARPGRAAVQVAVGDAVLTLRTDPVAASQVDPVRGEVRTPVSVMPPITVLLERALDYTAAERVFRRRLVVEVRSWTDRPRDVTLRVRAPPGVTASDSIRRFVLSPGETTEIQVDLHGSLPRERHVLHAVAESEGETFLRGAIPVGYAHTDRAHVYRSAALWLDATPISAPGGGETGYLPGEGDFTRIALRQVDVAVTELTAANLDSAGLARFRRIAVGPLAFRDPEVRRAAPDLMRWLARGGRLVILGGAEELHEAGVLPPEFDLRGSIRRMVSGAEGFAPLGENPTWFTRPNRLDRLDFDEWIVPVARFLPAMVPPGFQPIMAAFPAADGPAMPVAWRTPVGRGVLLYTGLTMPRQVLAGEAGALRLLVNLLFAPAGS